MQPEMKQKIMKVNKNLASVSIESVQFIFGLNADICFSALATNQIVDKTGGWIYIIPLPGVHFKDNLVISVDDIGSAIIGPNSPADTKRNEVIAIRSDLNS